MWKRFVTDYLNFTKRERKGIIFLLAIIGLLIMLPYLYPLFMVTEKYDPSEFKKEIAALQLQTIDSAETYTTQHYTSDKARYQSNYPKRDNYSNEESHGELFYFDPNTATENEWKRLGLREKTIATIQKYTSKGGKFYKPEDIAKIWGLRPAEVARLMPYVKIEVSVAERGRNNQQEFKPAETKFVEKPASAARIVNINEADTTALIALPGIGSKLSQRILNFREKLGGFYSVDQVGETFGLPDSTFQKIKPMLRLSNSQVRQVNINTATLEELKSHPYLRYAAANAIIQYRNQHGNFTSVEDIKKIMLISDEVYTKASPYLKVN